ncbi:uncharacterized protein LOC123552264 [Mercenaria mercenaria]|uniref:uncharacterized protein LOC123552264 n=1 Tax=Mercenaria mercenaria TaxID=6596 RepID=UPI00234F9464|nr:uncharacterized protein LOC123552264 [Mercenaria mercenaria]
MSATHFFRTTAKNPDDDFVLHGKSTSYWERSEYPTNSQLTLTTSRLSQHSIYNPDNYRERKHEKKYARSLTDLANNLEYLSDKVDNTLSKGVTFKDEDRQIEDEIRQELREEIEASTFTKPVKMTESLRRDLDEDNLLDLYEKHVGEIDDLSGKPTSPRDAQWFVNPNHLDTTCEAPTLQSIGKTYRYGDKCKKNYADKDSVALDFFPVTLGSSYELCALDYPASEPLNRTAPPSLRTGRSKSASRLGRSKSASRLGRSHQFRTVDRSFNEKQDLDKLYLMTKEAPTIGKSSVQFATPHELILGKLRMERLKLEEAKLLELKRLEELERIRGPKPKWYESTGPEFHYEAHKNTQLIRSVSDYQDMLDYREDLLRSSYDNLKKYNKSLVLA